MTNYNEKYIKYKKKYINLKSSIYAKQTGGEKLRKKYITNSRIIQNSNNMDNIKIYEQHLSEPWFSLISLGLKTVEGRKNKGIFKEMQVGEIIKWKNTDFKERSILTKMIKKVEYKTFKDYLNTEGLDKCLPGIPSLDHGLSVYFKYFTKEEEKEFGVIAIHLELL